MDLLSLHWTHWLLLLFVWCNLLIQRAIGSPNPKSQASISTSLPLSYSGHALFGVRGGAFFGFGKSSKPQESGNSDGGNGDDDAPKRFPALSQDEIEEKLNIPVFGLTDTQGNGVILSESGSKHNVFHLFFSKHMADAALKAVIDANSDAPPLKVSAFHLGKCWFKLIDKSGSQMFSLHKYSKDSKQGGSGGGGSGGGGITSEEITKAVHFRLVPNAKDLMGARVLTGLTPVDVEQLKDAVMEPNPPKALSILQNAANSAACSFKSPFDEIPVFAIAQMRVQKKDDQGNAMGNNMMPFHFSTKTMNDTWQEFLNHSPQFQDAEATLQLIELHKMIEMMQSESDFDFRNIVFIYPEYDKYSKDDSDDDTDENDDGGGGDNGMKKADDAEDFNIEPFYSMEVFAAPTLKVTPGVY
jgi:hypothetical protein